MQQLLINDPCCCCVLQPQLATSAVQSGTPQRPCLLCNMHLAPVLLAAAQCRAAAVLAMQQHTILWSKEVPNRAAAPLAF